MSVRGLRSQQQRSDQATLRAIHLVAVWTLRGRPVVLCQGYISKQDVLWHEFQSLSDRPFAGTLREEVFWQPQRAGVEWQLLVDAPAPATNPPGRLRQMRAFAAEFTAGVHFKAVSTDSGTSRHELRLLPQPLHRYSSADDNVLDGGLFAFVQGTNPEVVLLEARGKEAAQTWHYALAPASAYEVEASRSGAKIWGVPNQQGKKSREGPFWIHRFEDLEWQRMSEGSPRFPTRPSLLRSRADGYAVSESSPSPEKPTMSSRTLMACVCLLVAVGVARGGSVEVPVADTAGTALANATVWLAEGESEFVVPWAGAMRLTEPRPALRKTSATDDTGTCRLERDDAVRNFWWRGQWDVVWAWRSEQGLVARRVPRRWPDDGEPVRCVLPAATTVEFVVQDIAGEPVPEAKVLPERWRGLVVPAEIANKFAGATNRSGRVRITGLRADDVDRWRVMTAGFGEQLVPRPRPDAAGSRVLRLHLVGRVILRLTADDPQAIRRVPVRLCSLADGNDPDGVAGWAEGQTDNDGRLEVAAIVAGRLHLAMDTHTELPFRAVIERQPLVEPGGTTEQTIPLRRAVRVTGVVRERGSEQPVVHTPVKLSGSGYFTTVRTDATGKYAATVPAGHVTISFIGLSGETYFTGNIWSAQIITPDPPEQTIKTLELARGGSVTGLVVTEAGEPVGGAEVVGRWTLAEGDVYEVGTWSNRRGEFALRGVDPAMDVQLTASRRELHTAEPITARANAKTAPKLIVRVRQGLSLGGRVVDPSGRPVSDMALRVQTRERNARGRTGLVRDVELDQPIRTNAQGEFSTPPWLLREGEYRVEVREAGWRFAESEWIEGAPPPAKSLLDFLPFDAKRLLKTKPPPVPASDSPRRFNDLVLHPVPRLLTGVGRVIDTRDKPVAGVSVRQSGDGPVPTSTVSDADGRFRLSGVCEGEAILLTAHDGLRHEVHLVRIDGESISLTVRRTDEPPQRLLATLPMPMTPAAAREFAQPLLEPTRQRMSDQTPGGEHLKFSRVAGFTFPVWTLQYVDQVVMGGELIKIGVDSVRGEIVSGLAVESLDDAVEALSLLQTPLLRASKLLELGDDFVGQDQPRREQLLHESLLQTRSINDPGFKVELLGKIAVRWIELGDATRGYELLREGQALAEGLPAPSANSRSEGAHRRARFAGHLAWIDPQTAIRMTEGWEEPFRNRYVSHVARGLARKQPELAEELLDQIKSPGMRGGVGFNVLYPMAAADPDLALRLARGMGEHTERAYAVGLLAHALTATAPDRAAALLDEAFELLE